MRLGAYVACGGARLAGPWARVAMTLVAALSIVGVVGAADAAAHSALSGTRPDDHEVVTERPEDVRLEFTSPVTAQAGALQVFGPDGQRVDTGTHTTEDEGSTLVQEFDGTAAGTYAVSWRVTSDDGHAIEGTFAFHVEQRSGDDAPARERAAAATRDDRIVDVAYGVSRALLLVGVLGLCGGGLFVALAAPTWQQRVVWPFALAALAGVTAAYGLDAVDATGGTVRDLVDPGLWRAQLETRPGVAIVAVGAGLVASLAAALSLRAGASRGGSGLPARLACILVLAAGAATLSLTGHARSAQAPPLRLPLDMLHVVAAAVWIGGVVQLRSFGSEAASRLGSVTRYSRLAFAAVVTLVATGAYAVVVELGMEPGELVASQYGRLVVAKLLLYLGVVALGYANQRVYIPALRQDDPRAPAMLRQYVGREALLLVLVVGLTAWLVHTPPPS